MNVYYDKILDYKRGLLSDDEIKEFELAISKDADLKNAVENADILEMIGDVAFEKETKGLIEKAVQDADRNTSGKYRIWLILIGVLILTITTFQMISNYKKNTQHQGLIAEVTNDYTPPQVLFERGENKESNFLNLAKEAFSKREFEKAKTILLSSEFIDTELDDVHFLLAHIYFINKEYDLSQIQLNMVKNKDIYQLQDLLNRLK